MTRLRVLSGALRAFAEATTDYERLLEVVARTVSEVVADGCIVRLLSEGGWLTPVAMHLPFEARLADPEAGPDLRAFMAAPRNVAEYAWGPDLMATGEPFLLPHLDMTQFRTVVTPEVAEVYEAMGIHSMLVVVLRVRGVSIGTLTLFRFDPASPALDEADQEMAQALADHAALAIGNARSYAAERAARDAALRATARFNRLSEAGLVGTVVVDLEGRRVVEINDTLLQMLGYTREELVDGGVPWVSLTAPEWSEVDARAVEELETSGVAGLREKEFIHKDGTRVPVLLGSAMLGEGTTECISFVLDLTQRKEAERGRWEAERRSQRIVESATVGMLITDAAGLTTFMNARLASLLGVSAEEARGAPAAAFLLAEDRPAADVRLAQRSAGVAAAYEQRFRRPDGTVGVLWTESSPMYDAAGRFEGVLAILSDVTDRHRAEEALRASEQRYRLMFDNSPLPKWTYDVDSERILDVNAAAVRDYGYSREDFLCMTVSNLGLQDEMPKGQADAPRELAAGRLRKKDGVIVQVELTRHTFAFEGRRTCIVVAKDVTGQRQLEEQLRQAQKMEAVGRLAGGVAHDFNNVLSVILSNADLLLADLEPEDPARADLEEIAKAGARAGALTRQLLMFSRQQVLAPKVMDLNDVLTNLAPMLERLLGADVDLVALPTKPLGRVRADPSSIEQVLVNLAVNARDAMPTGGKLTMETRNVVLDEAYAHSHRGVKPGPHVMLAVSDTGVGIEEPLLSKIFEPFFTTKEVGKGTGLGLSTVFGVVQQSGGSIWVYSEVGTGTTFKLYFPRVDELVDGPDEVAPRAIARGTETILLVEDDDQVRAVAGTILRKAGYHVIDSRNAGEALLHSERFPGEIHLLLSDVVLPQMSGLELARRLASARPGMRLLCMSGYTDDSIVRHGILARHVAYLQKPLTPELLTARVRDVLDA